MEKSSEYEMNPFDEISAQYSKREQSFTHFMAGTDALNSNNSSCSRPSKLF
jgi:hypothetical protein